jgi:hypothetical protein
LWGTWEVPLISTINFITFSKNNKNKKLWYWTYTSGPALWSSPVQEKEKEKRKLTQEKEKEKKRGRELTGLWPRCAPPQADADWRREGGLVLLLCAPNFP